MDHGLTGFGVSPPANLPWLVQEVIEELTYDLSILEVWLAGSRANRSATGDSDWDLLVFTSVDPVPVPEPRRPGVDVIVVGPSGSFFA